MSVRKATAKPCARKGADNGASSNLCECYSACQARGFFLNGNSRGLRELSSNFAAFPGCQAVEAELTESQLIRYDAREISGLEVLFDGIEKLHDLNASVLNDQNLYGIDTGDHLSSQLHNFQAEAYGYGLGDSDDPEPLGNIGENSQNRKRNHELRDTQTSHSAAIAPSKASEILGAPPFDLNDSNLRKCWSQGVFKNASSDLRAVAFLLMKYIDEPWIAKSIWPRWTEKRFQSLSIQVWLVVEQNKSVTDLKFEKLWQTLTKNQQEALRLEWFYEDREKPTQEELALQVGISVDSFKERLSLAYKKIEKLYPEFQRMPRRNKSNSKKGKKVAPEPLFRIEKNGERTPLECPKKKDRIISFSELTSLKRKFAIEAQEKVRNMFRSHPRPNDVILMGSKSNLREDQNKDALSCFEEFDTLDKSSLPEV